MMKIKKMLFATLIILVVVILTYVGYLVIIKNNSNYDRINQDTKEEIMTVINKSKGGFPNLQTDSFRASWIDDAHNKQKEMMDKVLDTLTVVGESKKGLPKQYIIATYYDNMNLYIAYHENTPDKNIIIECNGHYYVATADIETIKVIVDYMKKALLITE